MAKIPFQQNLVNYYIGIDGGGTKTKFVLLDFEGTIIDECTRTTCHFSQIGFPKVGLLLEEGITTLLHRHNIARTDVLVGIGIAGYGRDANIRVQLEESIGSQLNEIDYVLTNDVEIALYGALGLEDGIVVISGTGSIAFAKQAHQTLRCGGWGVHLGDEGSGYDLGRKVLSTFAKQADGRMEKTILYSLIMEHFDLVNDYDLVTLVNENHSREQIASFSQFAYEAAKLNDECALQLFDDCAKELALLANTLAQEFTTKVSLSYIGGVFKSKQYILEPLQYHLHSKIMLQEPLYSAEYGAVLYALQQKNKDKR